METQFCELSTYPVARNHKSVAQLKPASLTTKVHAVKPGTPYDLVLPTARITWSL